MANFREFLEKQIFKEPLVFKTAPTYNTFRKQLQSLVCRFVQGIKVSNHSNPFLLSSLFHNILYMFNSCFQYLSASHPGMPFYLSRTNGPPSDPGAALPIYNPSQPLPPNPLPPNPLPPRNQNIWAGEFTPKVYLFNSLKNILYIKSLFKGVNSTY